MKHFILSVLAILFLAVIPTSTAEAFEFEDPVEQVLEQVSETTVLSETITTIQLIRSSFMADRPAETELCSNTYLIATNKNLLRHTSSPEYPLLE